MYTDKKGRKWFKGNLHTHTDISDGVKSPEDTLDLYIENGYDFISITDHWKWNFSSFGKNITVIPGCEYDFGKVCGVDIYHIVALGCGEEPKVERTFTPQMAIDTIHQNGGICNLAHPAWSLNSPEDLMKLKNVDMSEIFNSISDIPFNCRAYSGTIFDTMAARGCIWNLCATDDTHFYKESDTCRSFVYVNAESAGEKDILLALKNGNYYSSQGPTLDIEVTDGVLYAETSPVEEIVFYTGKAYVPDRSIVGTDMTHVSYKIKPVDKFVRVEVKDKDGNYAWSQYINWSLSGRLTQGRKPSLPKGGGTVADGGRIL